MTEDSGSVVIATTGVTQITGENTMTTSLPRGIEFYFQCAVLIIGIVGTGCNGLILYALVASKQHKKHALIVHQNALDLLTCLFIVIIYSTKLCNIYLTGSLGYFLCTLVLSESLAWWGTIASVINLASITVERYLKVVYPVRSKKWLGKNWTIYLAMGTAWIVSFTANVAIIFPTSAVMDGLCYPYMIWKNGALRIVFFIWNFLSFYVLIISIFVFCYWRILVVIRRQARVMADHNAAGSSAAQTGLNHIQTNVIKTMVIVSTLYTVSWLPAYVYYLLISLSPHPTHLDFTYYGSAFLAFSYMCTNPFIYATKFDPVKRVLVRMIPWKKTSQQATVNVINTGGTNMNL